MRNVSVRWRLSLQKEEWEGNTPVGHSRTKKKKKRKEEEERRRTKKKNKINNNKKKR